MFNKGDCIVYGTNGVCRVTEFAIPSVIMTAAPIALNP